MSQFTVGQMAVDIIARLGQLDKGLKEAERRTAASGDRIEQQIEKQGLGGVTKAALKTFAAFSLVEAGVKTATALTKIWKGDTEDLEQLVASLPLGIGPLTIATRNLLDEWNGIADRQRESLKIQEQGNRQLQIAAKLAKQRVESEKQLASIQRQGQVIGLTGFRRDFESLAFQSFQQEQELRDRLRVTQDTQARRNLEDAIGAVRSNFQSGAQALLTTINSQLDQARGGGRFGEQINTRFQPTVGIGIPAKSGEERRLEEIIKLIKTAIAIPPAELN